MQAIKAGHAQANYESIPAVLQEPAVIKLKEQESEAERKLSEAGKRYGAEHPRMIQAKAELDAARENLKRQAEIVVVGLSREYEVARANEQAVERALGQSKADIQGINRKEFQLGVLEREVQQNRSLYDLFVGRLKETVATGRHAVHGRKGDRPATVPGRGPCAEEVADRGNHGGVALSLSAMLALLLDRLSNTLNSTLPWSSASACRRSACCRRSRASSRRDSPRSWRSSTIPSRRSRKPMRTVRTSVLMSALDHPQKVVLVTSSVPEEGKTTLSFNLACALGQVKKVLLVDADMRRPKIGKLLGRDAKAPGLADLVAGQAQVSQCVFLEERSGIHVLPAGTVPPNPLELLSSKRFEEVLARLQEGFDIIVIDSAPLQMVSDALVLSQNATSVIYVVKADSTPYQVAQNGIKRLRRANAPLLGVVLNQLDLDKAERYYGEHSGYGKYSKKYGYGYGKPADQK